MSVLGLVGLGVVLLVLGLIFTIEVLVHLGWIIAIVALVLYVVDFFLARSGKGFLGSRSRR